MSRKITVRVAILATIFLIVGLILAVVKGDSAPSENGDVEARIAIEDMRRYCAINKIDCSLLRVEKKVVPSSSSSCEGTHGNLTCSEGTGHWEFIVQIGGERYLIAVLPFGDRFIPVGPLSEITHLK
jgi:hypothetical protein